MAGFDAYGGEGDGYGRRGGVSDIQLYEENLLQLRRNAKVQRAAHLARGIDFMLAEVLDDCSQCGSIQTMVSTVLFSSWVSGP